ncbi:MAG: (d)CMP kinase [Alphaproteobacteria bacterium]|nr:(d)CMP kinase [Alphaproteobacteria bacterium]
MIITIDGPAAAGKGTVSAYLAEKYKLAYFDTGMVYRAVGLQMVLTESDVNDEAKAEQVAKELSFPKMMELSKHKDFRSDIGGQAASVVSAHPKVRAALLKMQQNFALNPTFADGTSAKGVVYDGRDTGTVVCPDAELKLFITASTEIRAQRRYKEFVEKGIQTSYEKVLEDMVTRDKRDSSRSAAPLKPAEDAIIIDTSSLNINEVLQKIIPLVEAKL